MSKRADEARQRIRQALSGRSTEPITRAGRERAHRHAAGAATLGALPAPARPATANVPGPPLLLAPVPGDRCEACGALLTGGACVPCTPLPAAGAS